MTRPFTTFRISVPSVSVPPLLNLKKKQSISGGDAGAAAAAAASLASAAQKTDEDVAYMKASILEDHSTIYSVVRIFFLRGSLNSRQQLCT